MVDEQILAAIDWGNKSVTFFRIKPLNFSLRHIISLFVSECSAARRIILQKAASFVFLSRIMAQVAER